MVKKSKIYTRTGDRGKTSLFGGKRISKSHQRINAIGALDELNASLGIVCSLITVKRQKEIIEKIQNDLFQIGAMLANEREIKGLDPNLVLSLEKWIDILDEKVPPLKNFILPGGSLLASQTQLARSIARRAEREVASLETREKLDPEILKYLNRLADLLFVLARYFNQQDRKNEKIWKIR